jgi:SpoVK/Ycf46/Vps4 family AAA+-type ATPase
MLRPGRLDKLLYVPLPTPLEREQILKTQTRSTPLSSDVVIATIAADERCNRISGADLAALVREASVASLHEYFTAEEGLQDAAVAEQGGMSISDSTTATTTTTKNSNESKKPSRRRFGSVHPIAVREGVAGDSSIKLNNSSSTLPSPIVCHRHFLAAFSKVSPSVSVADERQYNSLRTKLRSAGSAKGLEKSGE